MRHTFMVRARTKIKNVGGVYDYGGYQNVGFTVLNITLFLDLYTACALVTIRPPVNHKLSAASAP
jgi:hypothetical protein